jgi:hypothetical protein
MQRMLLTYYIFYGAYLVFPLDCISRVPDMLLSPPKLKIGYAFYNCVVHCLFFFLNLVAGQIVSVILGNSRSMAHPLNQGLWDVFDILPAH